MAFEATVAPAFLRGNGSSGPLLHFPNYYAGFRRFGFQLESQLPRGALWFLSPERSTGCWCFWSPGPSRVDLFAEDVHCPSRVLLAAIRSIRSDREILNMADTV